MRECVIKIAGKELDLGKVWDTFDRITKKKIYNLLIIIKFFIIREKRQRNKSGNFIPAAGVMQTRPVIIPCMEPSTEGFPKKNCQGGAMSTGW